MTKSVSFQTPRGATIEVTLLTETPNLADHTVVNPAWEMMVQVNGEQLIAGWFGLVDHESAGRCIRLGDNYIQVPAEAADDVEALIGEYDQVRLSREAAADRRNADYERHYAAVSTLLHNEQL